jgi:hypothetical protein
MHEKVHQRAGGQEDPGKVWQQMRPVLGNQQERADAGKHHECKIGARLPRVLFGFEFVSHIQPFPWGRAGREI